MGSLDDLAAGYAEVAGTSLDADVVRWWEICGNLRWGLICMSQAQRHLSGATRSVELAAIGRRVCEQEHELLRLLGVPEPVTRRPTGARRGRSVRSTDRGRAGRGDR